MATITNRDFYKAVISGNITDDVIETAQALLTKMDAANAKRREKNAEKSKDYATYIDRIVDAAGADALTASDFVALFGDETRADGKAFNVQFVSYLCRQAVEEGKLTVTDVKVKGKGTCKGYTAA